MSSKQVSRVRRVGGRAGIGLLLPLLVLPACRGDSTAQDPGILLEVAISPTPPGVGPARLIITVRDTLGGPLVGAEIHVEGNMSHAGMAPVTATAVEQGEGLYAVPDFTFTMAGDWTLTVSATLPDGRRTLVRKDTNVVNAPPGLGDGGGRRDAPSHDLGGQGSHAPASQPPGGLS